MTQKELERIEALNAKVNKTSEEVEELRVLEAKKAAE